MRRGQQNRDKRAEEPPEKRQATLLAISEESQKSFEDLMSLPIAKIPKATVKNSLFDSFNDAEVTKMCVFSKGEILDLSNFLSPSVAKLHSRGRRPHSLLMILSSFPSTS